jgi:hypothetical protein
MTSLSIAEIFAAQAAKVSNKSSSKPKTLKGERSAAKAEAVKPLAIQHICQTPEFDELEMVCAVCEEWESKQLPDARRTWNPPMTFAAWVISKHDISYLKTEAAARKGGFVELADEYREYVNSVFNEPATEHLLERIVRREVAKQRQGKNDLGLLGYSPEDIVSMALWRAYVNVLVDAVVADLDLDWDAATIKAARATMRDYRSGAELSRVARFDQFTRYVFDEKRGKRGALRRQTMAAPVRHARTGLELRETILRSEFYRNHAADLLPSAGSVYREVGKVYREGFKQFNRVLEGLTPEGVFSESLVYDAIQVGDLLVNSPESEYFHKYELDELKVDRAEMLQEYLSKSELGAAEAKAIAFVHCLNEGYSLAELEDELGKPLFNRSYKDALELFAA